MKFRMMVCVALVWLDGVFSSTNVSSTIYDSSGLATNDSSRVLSRQRRYIVFPKGSSLQLLLELLVHAYTDLALVLGPTIQVAWPLPSEPLGKKKIPKPSSRKTFSSIQDSFVDNHLSHFHKFLSFNGEKMLKREKRSRNLDVLEKIESLFKLFGMTVGLAWQLPDDPKIYSDHKTKHKMYKRSVYSKMEAFMRPGGSDGRQCVLRALCESGQRTPSKKGFVQEILHKIFSMSEEEEEDDSHEDRIYRRAHRSVNQDCKALYPGCNFSIFEAVQ